MGFSVSSATIIIFIAILLSFGVFYGSWSSSQDILSETKKEIVNNRVEKIQTDIDIVEVTFNASGDNKIRINSTNTGTTTLEKKDVTIIIEGEHQDYSDSLYTKTVKDGGDLGSNYWYPNEHLVAEQPGLDLPNSVKIITGNGISDVWTN